MKIHPVKSYKSPKYPQKDYFESQPKLLEEYVPDSWKRTNLITTAIAVFTLVSCIPLLGGCGCVVVSPPIFLTEEEARQIIVDKLKKANITFDQNNVQIDDITLDSKCKDFVDGKSTEKASIVDKKLVLDGFNSKYNVGYTFISNKDCIGLCGEFSYLSYSSIDDLWGNLNAKLKKYEKMKLVAFYDPRPKSQYAEEKTLKTEKIVNLEKQVDDFIDRMRRLDYFKGKE